MGDKNASGEVKKPPERSKKWMSKNVPKWPSRRSKKGSKNEPLKGPYFRHVFEKEAVFQNLRWTRNGKRVSTSAISRARGRDFSELSLTRTQPQTSTERRGQTTAATPEAKEPYSRRFAALLLPNLCSPRSPPPVLSSECLGRSARFARCARSAGKGTQRADTATQATSGKRNATSETTSFEAA